ncbi:hypothetical protein VTO73DRAFT_5778 [Trametes versicolor]
MHHSSWIAQDDLQKSNRAAEGQKSRRSRDERAPTAHDAMAEAHGAPISRANGHVGRAGSHAHARGGEDARRRARSGRQTSVPGDEQRVACTDHVRARQLTSTPLSPPPDRGSISTVLVAGRRERGSSRPEQISCAVGDDVFRDRCLVHAIRVSHSMYVYVHDTDRVMEICKLTCLSLAHAQLASPKLSLRATLRTQRRVASRLCATWGCLSTCMRTVLL